MYEAKRAEYVLHDLCNPAAVVLLCADHELDRAHASAYLCTKEVFESQGLNVLRKAVWNPRMKDVAEMKAFYGGIFFFLIEQTIQKKWQSLFGWPAQRGLCVCEAAELEKKYFAGSTVQF